MFLEVCTLLNNMIRLCCMIYGGIGSLSVAKETENTLVWDFVYRCVVIEAELVDKNDTIQILVAQRF